MKKTLFLLLGLLVLLSSCKSEQPAKQEAKKELTREERIMERTKELEKVSGSERERLRLYKIINKEFSV